ncbi:MAG: hypothetical protein U5L10_05520 [Candidatus Moranbacteria bacterium]|nr:hypothetical protein [Candidatus Moranbacteria bacterium]
MKDFYFPLVNDWGDLVVLAMLFLIFFVISFVRRGEKKELRKEGTDLGSSKELNIHSSNVDI